VRRLLVLGCSEYRRFLDPQPDVESGCHQHDAGQKRDAPSVLDKGSVLSSARSAASSVVLMIV
jgi:hypothetical protein